MGVAVTEKDLQRGRVAVVSGAGTGIGRAIAVKFGALGWRVAVGGRRVDRLDETVSLVQQSGGIGLAHQLDVMDAGSVEQFFADVESRLGPGTVVINNAGAARFGPLDNVGAKDIEAEVVTKLVGSLYMARRGIQAMRREGTGGDVLFLTSISAAQAWPFQVAYSAANAGVEHAAKGLRFELEGTGIRVSVLRCGETIGTDFSLRDLGSEQMQAATDDWFRRGIMRHSGLMTPDMVADAVVAAVTLPAGYQYDLMTVIPTAPIGELPRTLEEFGALMMRHMPPSGPEPIRDPGEAELVRQSVQEEDD
jgi:NAD(P)-dependent dehydrogenase (short-subunit alcohol dehydrogenase family)